MHNITRVVFMGTPEFSVPCLKLLLEEKYEVVAVITQPDKPKGRGKKLCPPPVKEFALEHGLPVLQPDKIKTEEFISAMHAINPELIVTAAYGKILPKALLDLPPYGCINVHASLLPKYRGAAPIHWAVINGEKKTGITTMMMDEGLDTGDMLVKSEVEISQDMTTGELHDILKELGASALKQTLDLLKQGTLKRIPQNNDEATYAPMITKDIGKIDWKQSSHNIHNLVRGTNPWPGAFAYYRGERLKIWKTVLCDFPACSDKPGTICKIAKDALWVVTGDGAIKVTEVQFDNCRKMGVCECGHNVKTGEILE